MKILLACDFDHTIIDDNSDTWIEELCPDKTVPSEIRKRYKVHNSWTDYMDEIFRFLYLQEVAPNEIIQHMQKIPFVKGMKELLQYQAVTPSIDTIIMSDSNEIFINCILEKSDLSKSIDAIYTNPAEFSDGCLLVCHYHKHECKRCPANLCKSKVLQDHLDKCKNGGNVYDVVVVVGDGSNDFCPCLGLSHQDLIFARRGFRLERKIAEYSNEDQGKLHPKVTIWDSGSEIQSQLEALLAPSEV